MQATLTTATLLDVRTPGEYAHEHIEGAINIPLDLLPFRLHEVRAMTKPIMVYCHSGGRSGLAVTLLQQNGISEVYNGGSMTDLVQQIK